MIRFLFLLCCIALPMFSQGQGEADWWYFGDSAGMHFGTNGPTTVLDGALSTSEGVATISDQSGDLQFYTDGITVYNSIHQIMPNGTGLMGNSSSTQSAIIVPRPGNSDQYYIFTVQQLAQTEGLRYSLVDMSLAGGLGDVVVSQKNVPLLTPTSEKVASIKNEAGDGYWVVTHEFDTNAYHAFEVTASGVNTTAVVSNAGVVVGGSVINTLGYLKFSPTGEMLASGHHNQNFMQLFDFDRATGVVSNGIVINTSVGSYGVEFSPNEELLYTAGWSSNQVLQYDITSGVAATIESSEVVVGQSGSNLLGALQLGPDGKLYVARWANQYVAAIQDPNASGLACNYVDTAVFLQGNTCGVGFPTFISSFFNPDFEVVGYCIGDSTYFVLDTTDVDSVFWNFGDPATGSANTSQLFQPAHLYSDTGTFVVTLIARSAIDSTIDTVTQTVFIYPRQSVNLGGQDTALCQGDTLILSVTQPFAEFLWQDGSTNDSFIVASDSVLHVTVNGVCDTVSDTISVRFDQPFSFDLGPDSSLCEGDTLRIGATTDVEAAFLWNTGDTNRMITVSTPGSYVLVGVNGCDSLIDSIALEFLPIPTDSMLPPDTLNCFDNAIFLTRPTEAGVTYLWSDSSSNEIFEVDTTMTVWLAAFNQCGFGIDTFDAVFNGAIQTELGEDTIVCREDSIMLVATDVGASYQWNTGDTTDTIWSIAGETENYILTISKGLCQLVESRRVYAADSVCPDLDCSLVYGNVFTPNGDGWNDLFRITSDCDIFSFDMAIYNRWGQLVHYSRNVQQGWDGYINGEPASPGTYFFTVQYKDFVVVDADRFVTRGSFTLVR